LPVGHPRSWEKEDFIFDPLHYLALIEQKTNALEQAATLVDWELPEAFAKAPQPKGRSGAPSGC